LGIGVELVSHHLTPKTQPPMLDYLAIGHLTVDRLATGVVPGGTVAYAATTASRLGLRAGLLTSAGEDLDWAAYLKDIEIVRVPSPVSTSFENRYEAGRRVQRLLSLADPVPVTSVPEAWRNATIIHLAPVAYEVDRAFPKVFPRSLIGLTPQGLLRRWDGEGTVRQGRWAGDAALLEGCHTVAFSDEDLAGDRGFLPLCVERVPLVLLTQGARGATLFQGRQREHFPAFRVEEIDPTGAGDVFAAAFLIEYNLTGDPRHSTAFACCAASFVVERPGLAGIPDRPAVEGRLAAYRGL